MATRSTDFDLLGMAPLGGDAAASGSGRRRARRRAERRARSGKKGEKGQGERGGAREWHGGLLIVHGHGDMGQLGRQMGMAPVHHGTTVAMQFSENPPDNFKTKRSSSNFSDLKEASNIFIKSAKICRAPS